eukprot:GHVU01218389.1.p3 GENE.GHVU01218389.1~~GHVU01218389.1.p3  ORF type:complete len:106 (-),score=14.54 GHVU01218389.1:118-435(-)
MKEAKSGTAWEDSRTTMGEIAPLRRLEESTRMKKSTARECQTVKRPGEAKLRIGEEETEPTDTAGGLPHPLADFFQIPLRENFRGGLVKLINPVVLLGNHRRVIQ